MNRRTVLRATGLTFLGTGVAGCSSGSPAQNDGGTSNENNTPTESSGGSSGSKSFGGWMDNVGNYDGVVDKTGETDVTVTVGAEGNDGAFAFAPAAITIATGTTIVWEWTGKGSPHNVVDTDGNIESEMLSEQGATFEHTFERSGTVKYYCAPHESMGMKGVIVVE